MSCSRLRQAVLHPDLIKAPKEDLDGETVIGSDDEEGSHTNPQPSSSIQVPKRGVCFIPPIPRSVELIDIFRNVRFALRR